MRNTDKLRTSILPGCMAQFLFLVTGLSAQTADEPADTVQLEPIVVVGKRYGLALNDRPEAISVVDRQKLEVLAPMNMADALSAMPGVFMQKTNHGGGSPFIRGLTGYHTLIMIDGIRLNNAIFRSGPNQYLNTIDPLMTQQVEVLRGPGSVPYGTDAMGGTVYLRSKKPEFSQEGFVAGGSLYGKWLSGHMEKTGRSELALSGEKVAVLAGFSRKVFGNMLGGGNQGKQEFTSYDEYSGDIHALLRPGPGQTLNLVWQHHQQNNVHLHHKLITGDYNTYMFDPQKRDLVYLRHDLSRDRALFKGLRSTLSFHQSDETRKKHKSGSETLISENDRVRSFGFNMEGRTSFSSRWKGVTGGEIYHDLIQSKAQALHLITGKDSTNRGLYPESSSLTNVSLFTLQSYHLGKLDMSAGIRYNFFQIDLVDNMFSDLRLKTAAFVGSATVSYEISRNTRLSFQLGNAFRAPNINDVSSFGIADFRFEVPNFDLAPEKSLNKELGIKTDQTFYSASLHVYHNKLTDLISNVKTTYEGQDSIDGVKVYHRENVGSAYIAGTEAEISVSLSPFLNFYSYLIYTCGYNISKDEPLRRIPPLYGLIGMTIRPLKKLEILPEWQFAGMQDQLSPGDVDDPRIPEGGTPGWNVLHLRVSCHMDWLQINMGLLNILNEDYRTHGSGVDGQGRSFYLSLLFTFASS